MCGSLAIDRADRFPPDADPSAARPPPIAILPPSFLYPLSVPPPAAIFPPSSALLPILPPTFAILPLSFRQEPTSRNILTRARAHAF